VTHIDVGRLPKRTIKAGTKLYRIHRAVNGPWYFDDSVHGRFNPCGTPGRGTCYWADDPLGAWAESFRTVMTISVDDVSARAVSSITLRRDIEVADLAVKRALAAGVTVTVTAGHEYTPAQAIADDLQGRRDGVRYRIRHDLSGQLTAIGWFGDAGAATGSALAALPRPKTAPIGDDLIEAAQREFGYLVVPAPR
jgi:RES domain